MCLRFADMECKLGEIDRARAIYSFCSQICDPRVGDGALGWGAGGEAAPRACGTNACTLHRRPGPSGKRGRTSRSGMATRTPSARCCASAGACRPPTTRRSTSWPRRCSRCRAAPRAPVSQGPPLTRPSPGVTRSRTRGGGCCLSLGPGLMSWVREHQGPTLPPLSEGRGLGDRRWPPAAAVAVERACPPCLTPTLPPVSDLAPGQSGMDDMKLLEQRAEQLAAEAERDQPSRAQNKILFVR